MNENENTTTPNLRDSVKAVLRGRFIAKQAYLKKREKNQINNLTLHLKQLEKRRNGEPQGQQKERNNKNWAEINKKETKETIAKITKPEAGSMRRIIKQTNKITNLQPDSRKKGGESNQQNQK